MTVLGIIVKNVVMCSLVIGVMGTVQFSPNHASVGMFVNYRLAVDQVDGLDGDWYTLCCPVAVVQVVEVSAQALVENS